MQESGANVYNLPKLVTSYDTVFSLSLTVRKNELECKYKNLPFLLGKKKIVT